jgi:hypothetical protein
LSVEADEAMQNDSFQIVERVPAVSEYLTLREAVGALPGSFAGLMAADGVSGFYRQFGFAVRPPGRPGMSRR